MHDPELSRRPWLTHDLTLLLIVLMIAALVLGYVGAQVSIVWRRGAMRERIKASGGWVYPAPKVQIDGEPNMPKLRRLLGDEFVGRIMLRGDSATDVIEESEVAAEFPEAKVGVLLHYITP